MLRDGAVLVARRGFEGPLARLWEFPGGKVEAGEDDARALERELAEEFGVAARALRHLGETVFLHKGSDRELAAWLVELGTGSGLSLLEHAELRWVGAAALGELDLVDSDRGLLPWVLPLLAD